MKSGFRIVKDNRGALERAVAALTKSEILVGIPSDRDEHLGAGDGKNEREPETPGEPASGMNNATLGYIQNNGSPAANIPAREFMASGIKASQEAIDRAAATGARRAVEEGHGAVDKALMTMGLAAQRGIRNQINDGDFTQLAESTLAARRRRGFKDTKPLIMSAQLRNSINFIIRKKGS